MKIKKMRCKKCHSNDVVYIEDISCWRRVLGEKDGNTIIASRYKTEGFDEGGQNFRFFCRSCLHEWPADIQKCKFI